MNYGFRAENRSLQSLKQPKWCYKRHNALQLGWGMLNRSPSCFQAQQADGFSTFLPPRAYACSSRTVALHDMPIGAVKLRSRCEGNYSDSTQNLDY